MRPINKKTLVPTGRGFLYGCLLCGWRRGLSARPSAPPPVVPPSGTSGSGSGVGSGSGSGVGVVGS